MGGGVAHGYRCKRQKSCRCWNAGQGGAPGKDGLPGKSAYQAAVDGGYIGSEQEFNAALASIGDINAALDAINGEVV